MNFLYILFFLHCVIDGKIIRVNKNNVQVQSSITKWGESIPWPAESKHVIFKHLSMRVIPILSDKYYTYPFYHPENHTYLPFLVRDHTFIKILSQNNFNSCPPHVIHLYNESLFNMRKTNGNSFNILFQDLKVPINGFKLINKSGIFSPSNQAYSLLNSSEIKCWNGTVIGIINKLIANVEKADFRCYYEQESHYIINILILFFIAIIIALGIMICVLHIIKLDDDVQRRASILVT